MTNSVQDVITQIQHGIVSSYEKYTNSGNSGDKDFEGFLEQNSGQYFLPWAEQYKDSLKEQEQEQPTIEGFLTFCSREFFLSQRFLESEGNSGRIGAYRGAVAVASEQAKTIKPDFQGFLKFLCSGSVVSKDKFLTFGGVAEFHQRELKSPVLKRGQFYGKQQLDTWLDQILDLEDPINLLQKDTKESKAVNNALKLAFNFACAQSGLVSRDLPAEVEITADDIQVPNSPTISSIDSMLLKLDDEITDAWRYAAILVLRALDGHDSLKSIKGTPKGELIVAAVQAKCITGFLTVDLLTRPIGQQARDALRQETNAAKSFLDSLEDSSAGSSVEIVPVAEVMSY
jgi:hypothetical protein